MSQVFITVYKKDNETIFVQILFYSICMYSE